MDHRIQIMGCASQPWGYKAPPEVEIYELTTSSWRSVNPMGFPYVFGEHSSQTFLNGAAHWVGHYPNKLGGPSSSLIVSFDMGNEVFGVIMVPEGLSFLPLQSRVAVLEECLSVIHFTLSLYGDTCCVWAMKQYGVPESWTKQFTIDLKEGL
ncbi:F-box protein CPR1 [Camellia lanceoleosa]|nr:F-box protein CPR1 [Camellia lanceoleosa]